MNHRLTWREEKKQREVRWAIALIIGCGIIVIGFVPFFNWIDCNQSTRWAAAYQACISASDCTPTRQQVRFYESDKGAWKAHYCQQD